MNSKANFDYDILDEYYNQHMITFLLISDRNQGNISVTNDIERVISDILKWEVLSLNKERNNMIVLYSDSTGVWDEYHLPTKTFKSIGANDSFDAIQKYYQREKI